MAEPVLDIAGLTVVARGAPILDAVSIALGRGEIVGLTGPSGAGKSTLALAAIGLCRPPLTIAGGAVRLRGRDLLHMDDDELARVRGREIAIVLQNARSAFHPMLAIGRQIGRVWRTHHGGDGDAAARRAVEMLAQVGINDPARRARSLAQDLSGGMAQRALIGAALAADPAVLVADEPTSGLDVTIQAEFLDRMSRRARDDGMAMLLVTQEPGILATYCDRVAVLEDGRIVSDRDVRAHFAGRGSRARRFAEPLPTPARPLLQVEKLAKSFALREGGKVRAVADVDLVINRGETLGLVGESGSGKTTAGRCILRLVEPDSGRVLLDDTDLAALSPGQLRSLRARIQLVRQDPFDSFDPRWTIGRALAEPAQVQGSAGAERPLPAVDELLATVGCDPSLASARPRDLSAGTLQRLAIARALATNPSLVVLDEPTSVLAPADRARVIALIGRIQREREIAFLLISHDLSTVAEACHRVAVMYLGEIVEVGPTRDIFERPHHPYTRALIASHLDEEPRGGRGTRVPGLQGDVPSPIDLPPGCALAGRCPDMEERCRRERQRLHTVAPGRDVRCWRAEQLVEQSEGRP